MIAINTFSDALKKTADLPKTPAETLSEWQESMISLNAEISTKQKDGEISATDAADLIRKFDNISQGLEYIRQNNASGADSAFVSSQAPSSTELPQGMPAELALAMKRNHQGILKT